MWTAATSKRVFCSLQVACRRNLIWKSIKWFIDSSNMRYLYWHSCKSNNGWLPLPPCPTLPGSKCKDDIEQEATNGKVQKRCKVDFTKLTFLLKFIKIKWTKCSFSALCYFWFQQTRRYISKSSGFIGAPCAIWCPKFRFSIIKFSSFSWSCLWVGYLGL